MHLSINRSYLINFKYGEAIEEDVLPPSVFSLKMLKN